MAGTHGIPPVTKGTPNVMWNNKYAAQVVDTVNQITSAEVRIGTGPSSVNHSPGKTVIHISIEEIVNLLKAQGHI